MHAGARGSWTIQGVGEGGSDKDSCHFLAGEVSVRMGPELRDDRGTRVSRREDKVPGVGREPFEMRKGLE